MIPAVSTASDMVFVNGWYDNAGWKITGLDWATGKTRHQVNLGKVIEAMAHMPSCSTSRMVTYCLIR